MKYLQIFLLVLQALDKFLGWMRERELINAGEAKAIAAGLEVSNARITQALAARRRANNSDPDPDDTYRRD
jgi:hypothetical protein